MYIILSTYSWPQKFIFHIDLLYDKNILCNFFDYPVLEKIFFQKRYLKF